MVEPRIASAGFFAGGFVPAAQREQARQVTIPLQFLLQWDDEGNDRQSALDLFDAFGTKEKIAAVPAIDATGRSSRCRSAGRERPTTRRGAAGSIWALIERYVGKRRSHAMADSTRTTTPQDPETEQHPALLGRGMLVLFLALISCFTAWGVAQDLTTPMVAGFKRIFDMSTFQASLVQLAYFGAYFLLALPAAFINQRFGYKTGILTGLGLAAIGAFAFYPASKIMTYEAFLVALFAMAAGCSILETSANPYVISLGPEATATRRLNLAQAFNPVGTNIGVLLASTLILPNLADPVDISSLTPAELHTIRAGELGAVMAPYLGLAFLLILIAVAIASQRAPEIIEEFPDAGPHQGGTAELFRVLWRNKRYRFGVIAQFSNVAAQVCAWTYLIQYVQQALGGSLEKGGAYLQASLLIFLASRFLMTWLIGRVRATKVLAVLAFLAVLLCLFAMSSPNLAGVLAVVALSFCLSLMFPTIYGVALKGLGPATKFGAAGLVMAIVGGAIMPLVQGKLVDTTSAAISFVVPAACFVVVGLYALYDLRSDPSPNGSISPGPSAPDTGAPVGSGS